MENAVCLEKLLEFLIDILTSIIIMKNFHIPIKLYLEKSLKSFESRKHNRLRLRVQSSMKSTK